MASNPRVTVMNPLHPGSTRDVDAAMYEAMKAATLAVLPAEAPGLTADELYAAVLPRLPEALYPGGSKAGWWVKTVQLDLEARGTIVREKTTPLRLHRVVG